MNKHLFIFFLSMSFLTSFSPEALIASEKNKPNVIYILADDLGIGDVGAYGGTIIKTPRMDQLAAEGIKFTQHYSGCTVCRPSRSVLMTGKHMGHTRVRSNAQTDQLRKDDLIVSEIMKQAGYTTACIGKWGLAPAGHEGRPTEKGFDLFFGYLDQTRAHRYYPDWVWRNDEKVTYPENSQKRHTYIHDEMTKEAKGFIKDNQKNPFFLYLAYIIPHVDLDVPEPYKTPYSKTFGEEKPYKGGHYRSEARPHATFAGMVAHMDEDIGELVDLVDELGLKENTLIMFASDNGATNAGGADPQFFDSNGPYRGVKRDLYEGGIITPMIARWPGKITASSTTDHISAFYDVMPTLAELADQSVPKDIDGISFLPTLLNRNTEQKTHDYLYWEFLERGGKRALRKGDWKIVQNNVSSPEPPAPELYDLSKDIGETKNLAKEKPELVEQLTKLMDNAHVTSKAFPLFASEGAKAGKKKKKKGGKKNKKK